MVPLTPEALERSPLTGEGRSDPAITDLLLNWRSSDPEALAAVLPHLCADLQAMARSHMAREAPGHTLQPTALVNEFVLRLAARESFRWDNRRQFFGFAATTMRRILVDHARRRRRAKRGSGLRPVSLDDQADVPQRLSDDVVELGHALDSLCAVDPRKSRIVELRYFVGLSVEETAAALEISEPTVKREWRAAKLWLLHELSGASSAAGC